MTSLVPTQVVLPPPPSDDIALVLRHAHHHFEQAAHTLTRIQQNFAREQLVGLDLYADPPSLLLCLLRFAPGTADGPVLDELEEFARLSALRVLRLGRLSEDRRADFYSRQLGRFTLRWPDVQDLAAVLRELDEALRLALARDQEDADCPLLEHSFVDVEAFLAAHSGGTDEPDLSLVSEAAPGEGQRLRLRLRIGERQGPIDLSARVQRVVDEPGISPAQRLDLHLLLPPGERMSWEAFSIAAMRNEPWPGLSGRRYERFPVELHAEYRLGAETRQEVVRNLSRGGLFLDSFDPPPLGATLELQLRAPGSAQVSVLLGRVVWARDAGRAAPGGLPAGAGIEFIDDPARVDEAVGALLRPYAGSTLRRVLLADDDRFYRALLGHTLHLAGLKVLQACDGDAAFAAVLDELAELDLIVLDLFMPGMPVTELLEAIRDVRPDHGIPVVVISGAELDAAQRDHLRRLGVRAVLPKSLTGEALLEHIEPLIAR